MTQHKADAYKTQKLLNGVRMQPSVTSTPLTATDTVSPNKKFVSLFHIDGVPILPPVMTTEKRRLIQRLRERAIKIEMKLLEGRRKKLNIESESDDQSTLTARESNSGSLSQRSIEIAEQEKREIEDQCRLLSSFLETQQREGNEIRKEFTDSSTNTSIVEGESNQKGEYITEKRLQKLQKSETLIYDNLANAIIMPMSLQQLENDKQQEQQRECQQEWDMREQHERKLSPKQTTEQQCEIQHHTKEQDELYKAEQMIHQNFLKPQKPRNLALKHSLKKIPSICVDPPTPTPQVCSRSFTEPVEAVDNADTTNLTHNRSSEISSDESLDVHVCDFKRLIAHRKLGNISGKILQFEQFQSNESINTDDSALRPPQRSATSPSLKQLTAEKSPRGALEVSNSSSQLEKPLVRSNSFTLDCPSKALLEHIRQQKSRSPSTGNKRTSPSPSAIRDTVESKAKRVQKVEVKPRQTAPVRLQQSNSSSNNAASSSAAQTGNNAVSFKNKRSPYESKSLTKTKHTRQLKKSTSSTSAPARSGRNCMSSSMSQLQPTGGKRYPTDTRVTNFADLETEHRQKFIKLLEQQKQEQKRLQLAFERQQQMLFEQLSTQVSEVKLYTASSAAPQLSPVATSFKAQQDTTSSTEISPRTFSEYGDRVQSKSPSLNSTGVSDLPSLESTSYTVTGSNNINCNRYTPRRRLYAREGAHIVSNISTPNITSTTGATGGGSVVNGRRLLTYN